MLLTLLASAALAAAPDAPLRVATYDYPNYDRRAALGPLAELVGETGKRRVEILLLRDPDELAAAICRNEIDVAMMNLGSFVRIAGCEAKPLAVMDTPPGILDKYRGVLVVRRDTGISSLDQLPGRASSLRYSQVLPGSTSGALVQAAALRSVGLTPGDFASVQDSRTHEAGLEGLLSGQTDIAAFAEEPWRKLLADNPSDAAGLRLLSRSAPLPPGPLVCRTSAHLSCDALRQILLSPEGRRIAEALAEGWSETKGAVRFRPYEAAAYRPFGK